MIHVSASVIDDEGRSGDEFMDEAFHTLGEALAALGHGILALDEDVGDSLAVDVTLELTR